MIFHRHGHTIALLVALAIATITYWPGLAGGYLFDDFPNFVDNPDVHVSNLNWHDWRLAALASPVADLPRPLAMLSLAANYYCTQLDPFPMKLTNLVIHLLNGVLLWCVLLQLLNLWAKRQLQTPSDSIVKLAALGITCAWLLAPINVSAVLYTVQRMESLAQIFVLAGLGLYLEGRRRMLATRPLRYGIPLCVFGLVFGVGLGVLCKESAVLLPVYTLLIELVILRFDAPTAKEKQALWATYAFLLFVPATLGGAWLLPRTLSDAAYAGRPFTLAQRLLTEFRVLVDYMTWTLFPHPGSLSFYHDDIALSRGWLTPPATLCCAALLGAIAVIAILLRRQLPLFSLGIGWYFAAHLMTATIIPLELVFEHRNYFASIGLLLASAALILTIPREFKLLLWVLPALAIGIFTAVTWLRAMEWRNPIEFAYSEALRHPLSARANAELGQTLAVASGFRADSKLIDPAMEAFERAARLPDSSAAPLVGLIVVAGHAHRNIQPEWWTHLAAKLATNPPSAESITALGSLTDCQRKGMCPAETRQLLSVFLAALSHPQPSGRLLAIYGTFAANQLDDYPLAERTLSDAALLEPRVNGIRINLVKVLLLEKSFEHARQVLDDLNSSGLNHDEADEVRTLRKEVESADGMEGKS